MFTERSPPRHNHATAAGQQEGTKPKPVEDARAVKGGEEHAISEIISI
jgi:hypothetical protein